MRKTALIAASVCMAFALIASGFTQNARSTASSKDPQSTASDAFSQAAAGESPANQTIELAENFLNNCNIDCTKCL